MNIKIKENSLGHLTIDLQWTSAFAFEHEVIHIKEYPVGRKIETITNAILKCLQQKESEGRLRF